MREPEPFYVPQEFYDMLMSLPPGTDVTEFFEFSPGWDLKVATGGPRGAQPDAVIVDDIVDGITDING